MTKRMANTTVIEGAVFLMFTLTFGLATKGILDTHLAADWADDEGLHITGHWEVTFRIHKLIGLCDNLQIGLFGPNRSTSEGYFININKASGGKYYSGIRKICPSCPGTPEVEVEVEVDGSDSCYLFLWVSWDGCTIRLGKGTVVKEQEVVNWMDPHMTEIKYITFGTSDGSLAVYLFATMEANLNGQTIQNCSTMEANLTVQNSSCAAQARPVVSSATPAFIFHLSAEGKTFSSPKDLIYNATGLTRRECNCKYLCDQACLQYSVSTTGVCKLSKKCYPDLESDPDYTVHSLTNWSSKK